MNQTFLPVSPEEVAARGWDAPDFVYVCGERLRRPPILRSRHHQPDFGKRRLSGVMLCLPPWQDATAFTRFGRPKLGFLVTAGVIDSMVNHYTVAKKRRHEDAYAPGGQGGMRPDRATIVYCNRIRQAYHDAPILIGGRRGQPAPLLPLRLLGQPRPPFDSG